MCRQCRLAQVVADATDVLLLKLREAMGQGVRAEAKLEDALLPEGAAELLPSRAVRADLLHGGIASPLGLAVNGALHCRLRVLW